MRCARCNTKNKRRAKYCNYCGLDFSAKCTVVPIPEGFVFDKPSGWYHKIEMKRDKKGNFVQQVTYYNPVDKVFLQELPKTHSSYKANKKDEKAMPIGKAEDYLFDNVGEFYYLTDTKVNIFGNERVQRVSYYNPVSKTFNNINYLIISERKYIVQYSINGNCVVPSVEQEPRNDIYDYDDNIQDSYAISVALRIVGDNPKEDQMYDKETPTIKEDAINLWATQSIPALYSGNKSDRFVFVEEKAVEVSEDFTDVDNTDFERETSVEPASELKKSVTYFELQELERLKEKENKNIIDQQHSTANKSEKPVSKKLNVRLVLRIVATIFGVASIVFAVYYGLVFANIIPKIDTLTSVFSKVDHSDSIENELGDWPDSPNVSSIYKKAIQTDDYIYYLQEGAIYRISLDTSKNELFIEPEADNIYSFVLAEETIYYQEHVANSSEADYYKVSDKGGEREFLFNSDISALVKSSNKIYFMSPSSNKLFSFDFLAEGKPALTEQKIVTDDSKAYLMSNNFSVLNGSLYYCELLNNNYNYYKMNLENEKNELLLSSNSGGQLVNPFWSDNFVFYTKNEMNQDTVLNIKRDINKATEVTLGESSSFTIGGSFPIAENEKNSFYMDNTSCIIIDKSTNNEVNKIEQTPFAVTKDYVLFDNMLYCGKENRTYRYSKATNIPLVKN